MCARGRFCSLIPGLGVKFFVIIIAGLLFSPGEVVTASMMGDGLIVLPGAPDPSPGVSINQFFCGARHHSAVGTYAIQRRFPGRTRLISSRTHATLLEILNRQRGKGQH